MKLGREDNLIFDDLMMYLQFIFIYLFLSLVDLPGVSKNTLWYLLGQLHEIKTS